VAFTTGRLFFNFRYLKNEQSCLLMHTVHNNNYYNKYIIINLSLGVAKEEPEITTYSPPIDFKLGTTASQGIDGV
jgi:hypothetical protein